MRTLGQKRAEFALKKVLEAKNIDKFDSFTAGAPSQILQNGFGQTMAFYVAKGTDKHKKLFKIIQEWLSYHKEDIKNDFINKTDSEADFIKAISQLEQRKYLAAQKETLALLEWVKRFANAGF
jgi:CRISPR-associated protein Cmr5